MASSSSSRMRVINHNWSATKQRLHPQSVAEISHHSVLSPVQFGKSGKTRLRNVLLRVEWDFVVVVAISRRMLSAT